MQVNRRKIIISAFLIVLTALVVIVRTSGLEVFLWWASGGHGPVPFPVGTPAGPLASGRPVPSVTPTPRWGELLQSPATEIPGITWKTLHNDEYGFEMNTENVGAMKVEASAPQEVLLTTNNESSEVGGEKGEEVGRNDLCPCGSGKKYKKCHGK
mgnify:CR=1 FL=1